MAKKAEARHSGTRHNGSWLSMSPCCGCSGFWTLPVDQSHTTGLSRGLSSRAAGGPDSKRATFSVVARAAAHPIPTAAARMSFSTSSSGSV